MENKVRNNSGMVLVLSILIIAAVLATAVIFANLVIRQIRQSRLIDQSIQAYYLAESGSERALYQSRRREAVKTIDCDLIDDGNNGNGSSSCLEATGYCSGSINNQVSCISETVGTLDGQVRAPWNIEVTNEAETTINLNVGESFQLDLFSPFQDLSAEFNSQVSAFRISSNLSNPILYGELTNLTWLVGGSLLCPTDNFTPPKPAISKERINFNSGTTGYVTALGPTNPEINPFCSYILRISNILFPNVEPGQFTISIHSSASGDPEGNRLDIPSRLIIDSEATFGRSSQSVRVRTPIRPPLSGLYDFVLFSEEEIVK
jgi:hypothetical protein